MDMELKYLQLIESFNKKIEKYTKCNLEKFKDYAEIIDGKEVWTKAFNIALENFDTVIIPKGKYYVDKSLVISDDKRILADENAEIILLKNTRVLMLRNKDVIDGSKRKISNSEKKTKNLFIQGGVWGSEDGKRYSYGKEGVFDEQDSLHGVYCLMLFSGVENLWLKDMVFKGSGAFSIQIGRTENFVVENIKFVNCHADGVHVNGAVKNGVIRKISGSTGDDLVALNAYDWHNSTINQGSIESVYVDDIDATTGNGYKGMRLLPGIVSAENGEIDCYIKDLYISNVKGVSVFKMYLQTPSYEGFPDQTKVGWMDNVTIKNVTVKVNGPTDQMDNYVNGDIITGHFGLFELGSNVKKLTLENICVDIDYNRYPNTAHLITVGPKSCYLKEFNVELFDPYVNCVVDQILYKNIVVNGKVINDLSLYVKEIEFDKIYDSNLSSGWGKLLATRKIDGEN